MWVDFTKNIIPKEPILTKDDMELYKRYMKEINYTIYNDDTSVRKGKSKNTKKRFNRTPRKNRA
jgi:hypothetical protein